MWDAMEYGIHFHYTQFFETSIKSSHKLQELEIHSYLYFANCYLEMEIFYLNFKFFIFEFNWKFFELIYQF
jgi:hypothetical protein